MRTTHGRPMTVDVVVECEGHDDLLLTLPLGCTAAELPDAVCAAQGWVGDGAAGWEAVLPVLRSPQCLEDGDRITLVKEWRWAAKQRLNAGGGRVTLRGLEAAAAAGDWPLAWDIVACEELPRDDVEAVLNAALVKASKATLYTHRAGGGSALCGCGRDGGAPQQLLALGASPDARCAAPSHRPILSAAARAGCLSLTRRLLAHGAAIDARDAYGRTSLATAIVAQQYHVARALMAAGAEVDARDAEGLTPLLHCVCAADCVGVELLLDAGADAGTADRCGVSAVAAATQGRGDVLEVMVTSGSVSMQCALEHAGPDGRTPLMHAAIAGSSAACRLLCDAGACVDAACGQAPHGTALILAAGRGRAEACAELLDLGADPNAADSFGRRAVTHAAIGGYVRVLPYLIHARADCDVMDSAGKTPLMHSAAGGHIAVAEMLLEFGACVMRTDCLVQNTAILHAIAHGHAAVALLLLRHGADPNARNVEGKTPLIAAAALPWADMERTHGLATRLLESGASPLLADRNGKAARAHAEARGHAVMAAVLARAEAKPDVEQKCLIM
eukprot:TRINITY_DN32725_c0_g1_i1.p1 TRINITY_DN32725_c0_g1~~TRINITY_DN32725_c0_g1_i1.p1  ORF type:complete len:560 (+),score=103.97 TRINITY_DN32725_c0_g1_i1:101-1780(+)